MRRPKHLLILLLTIVLIAGGGVFAAVGEGDLSGRGYAPNEIIVKFKKDTSGKIADELLKGRRVEELELADSLDRLIVKHKAKSIKPLFRDFKQNRQRIQGLLQKDRKLLTKREKHFISRLRQVPEGVKVPDLDRIYKIELAQGQSATEAVKEYRLDTAVEYAELNYIVSTALTPIDPRYPLQWSLNNVGQMYPESGRFNPPPGIADKDIDAPEAWGMETGKESVIVAVIDTGVDYTHRDLKNNVWVNKKEHVGRPGVDDDGNGYVDDVYGYDFLNNDYDPRDDNGHGTHCAGTIAAEGNNGLDITGVVWDAQIMSLKFLGENGYGMLSDAVDAVYYAVNNNADILSNSWGGGGYSNAMQEAINYAYAHGVVFVAAAGNDNSSEVFYPASYEYVIAVAATDSTDERASFSNYGNWVEVRPGVDILSLRAAGTSLGTTFDAYTTVLSGTSMACPHVAGACALLRAVDAETTVDEITNILQNSADRIQNGICQSGRLNLNRALSLLVPSAGAVNLDRYAYSCSGEVKIKLRDKDLIGAVEQQVIIRTDGNDVETVLLIEQEVNSGIFSGSIMTSDAAVIIGDGILQIADGQIIAAEYHDANDGMGNAAIAMDYAYADCMPPLVSDVNVFTSQTGRTAKIEFKTDEPAYATVRYGSSCGGPYIWEGTDILIADTHAVYLSPLSAETTYYFVIDVIDAAGNERIEDNGGACYSFTTGKFKPVYVPDDYPTIQQAADAAWGDGDLIFIAPGVYGGIGNRDIDFKGKETITIRSLDPNDPNIVAQTVIDCNNAGKGFYIHSGEDEGVVIDGLTITNASDAAIHCLRSAPKIANCIIENNKRVFLNRLRDGGGVYLFQSNADIQNCVIRNNTAFKGGGIFVLSSTPSVKGCTIANNFVQHSGGGIYLTDGGMTIQDCNISSNSAGTKGGGVCIEYGYTVKINRCTVKANQVMNQSNYFDGYGGGIYCIDSKVIIADSLIKDNAVDKLYSIGGGICLLGDYKNTADISNSRIEGNYAAEGGGIYSSKTRTTINRCAVNKNEASVCGGIALSAYPNFLEDGEFACNITNSLITSNTSENEIDNFIRAAGAITANETKARIANCTVTGNKGESCGGVIVGNENSPNTLVVLENNIITNNRGSIANEIIRGGGFLTIAYCNIGGSLNGIVELPNYGQLIWGQGNIDTDPEFANAGFWNTDGSWVDGDYMLTMFSPCVDTGDPNFVPDINETDYYGNLRLAGERVDMGAFEFPEPIEAKVLIAPAVLNRRSGGGYILALVRMPDGIGRTNIDNKEKLTIYPCDVKAAAQFVIGGPKQTKNIQILALFDKDAVLDAIDKNGIVDLDIVGKLTSGKYFCGSDKVIIFGQPVKKPKK